jgi:hypothetical protein
MLLHYLTLLPMVKTVRKYLVAIALLLSFIFSIGGCREPPPKNSITWDDRGFKINGQYTLFIIGGIQYYRLPPGEWEERLGRLRETWSREAEDDEEGEGINKTTSRSVCRVLWAGMLVPGILFGINGLHHYFPAVGEIQTRLALSQFLVDYPWKAMAPLESLIQAAGRCNRENRLGESGGKVFLFKMLDAGMPDKTYAACAAHAEEFLRTDMNQLHDWRAFNKYYSQIVRLYVDPDRFKINTARGQFDFQTVNDTPEKDSTPSIKRDHHLPRGYAI